MKPDRSDTRWMRRALSLAAKGQGFTRPNPPVGAVVVRDDRMIGQGYHARSGEAHAEVAALANCSESPRGATLYVTLEPCSTHGRTPPCTARIIEHGIARVVYAVDDPNPAHSGRASALLRSAGVDVDSGVGSDSARELIAPFSKWVRTRMPYLTLKLALTLDGAIADRHGRSQWITGKRARMAVQQCRRRSDVVMVGSGTVLADAPSLRCRLAGAPPGMRLVVDSTGRIDPSHAIFHDGYAAQTMVATAHASDPRRRRAWRATGARVWVGPTAPGTGHVALPALLRRLGREGYLSIFCEGGAILAGALIAADLVDEYLFFMAPKVFGDSRARWAVHGLDRDLQSVFRLRFGAVRLVGGDLMIRAYRDPEAGEERCLRD